MAVCCLFAFCWFWAPKRLEHIRVRRAALYVVSDEDVAAMIKRGRGGTGGTARSEDLDPDLEINPIQGLVMLAAAERAKADAAKAKLKAAKAAKAAKLANVPKMLGHDSSSGFIEGPGAFAKLGIHISFKRGKKKDAAKEPSSPTSPDQVNLQRIDQRLEDLSRAALASSQMGEAVGETAEEAILRELREEAEAARKEALLKKKAAKAKEVKPAADPLAGAVDHLPLPAGAAGRASRRPPAKSASREKLKNSIGLAALVGRLSAMRTSVHKMAADL